MQRGRHVADVTGANQEVFTIISRSSVQNERKQLNLDTPKTERDMML